MSDAMVVVPPLVRYLAGPMAGPASLRGVAEEAGHRVKVIDLNAEYLTERTGRASALDINLTGDHAKPRHHFDLATDEWRSLHRSILGDPEPGWASGEDPVLTLCYGHKLLRRGALALAESSMGQDWLQELAGSRPHLFGVSVLWSGQVLAAMAISLLARKLWPGVPVVWGGPHVASLSEVICCEPAYGLAADGFVAGYAEQTFLQMLDGEPLAADGVMIPGQGRACRAEECWAGCVYGAMDLYGRPHLVLPVQLSRGCAYGKCAFCTYPSREGEYREGPLDILEPAVKLARQHGADLGIKDAYLIPRRADAVAEIIGGQVKWAACTRVTPALTRERLASWVVSGLRTLEVGVETLSPRRLASVGKGTSQKRLEQLLSAASGLQLHLVLNMIFGWPGQTLEAAHQELDHLTRELPAKYPETRFSVECNLLQLCRGAPVANRNNEFEMRMTGTWPWASVMGWSAPQWRDASGTLFQGHKTAVHNRAA